MDNLKVVRELRDLAAIPHNRATIVRVSHKIKIIFVSLKFNVKFILFNEHLMFSLPQDRGCLPGLVLFLDNSNQEVVSTALEVLINI